MLTWLEKKCEGWQRWMEADRRGWKNLGRMFAYGREWNAAKWGREIRRANRIYRLTRGHGNPWKPYRGI